MTVHRGQVVLVYFPFSSQSGGKVRPAVVVQADRDNKRLSTTMLAMVTKTVSRAAREPTQLLIPVSTDAGRQAGLLFSSAILCTNLLTVEQRLIRNVIGELPEAAMQKIDHCLVSALGLPGVKRRA